MAGNSSLALSKAYHWEATRPDSIYLTQPSSGGAVTDYTWRQTMDQVRRMAGHLKGLNFPPKSQIAILGKNSAHWIMADLAIWMAGHVSVPLYPTLAADSAAHILEHSESKLLFIGKMDDLDQMKPGIPDDMPLISLPLSPQMNAPTWDQIVAEADPITDNPEREPGEMATIIYTSGSTGTPKGVMLSFEGMMLPVVNFSEMYGFSIEDRLLSYLPLAHAYERCAVEMGSIVSGSRVYFAEALETFVQDLQRARPTFFQSVPRLYLKFQLGVFQKMPAQKLKRLLSIPILSRIVRKKVLSGLGLQHARFAISGSAPIPPEVIAWYRDLGLNLIEGYAMSENFAYSHAPQPGEEKVGYVGTPCPGVEARITDEGEILVKSPANMMGYFKEPEMTAESFTEDGFLKTGDMGELDEQGRLRITGRVKELFKTSKGKYIAPAPIENKLINHPLLEQACVCGVGQPQPHGLLMLSEEAAKMAQDSAGKSEIEQALTEHLAQVNATLEHHEALSFVAVVKDQWLTENGFLTPTMKIKRNVIEETYTPFAESWYAGGSPVLWQ